LFLHKFDQLQNIVDRLEEKYYGPRLSMAGFEGKDTKVVGRLGNWGILDTVGGHKLFLFVVGYHPIVF
jgi:hypothetical protein